MTSQRSEFERWLNEPIETIIVMLLDALQMPFMTSLSPQICTIAAQTAKKMTRRSVLGLTLKANERCIKMSNNRLTTRIY